MPTVEASRATKSKRPEHNRGAKSARAKSRQRSSASAATEKNSNLHEARVTKHDCVLTLLSRPEGVTIAELMQATNWQQHSVRGFLAGTVKKKLRFILTSAKVDGDVRRYRIDNKRSR
jgi:type IV secretory pathway VirB4 component